MEKISILVTDDHKLIREAWVSIINSDPRFLVVAECGSGEEAIELAKQLHPDVVIMDINLSGITGIETIPFIRRFSPGTKILGISMHTQPVYARKMIKKGAMGYVTKNSSREEMFKAIVEVNNGGKYICDEIKNIFWEQDEARTQTGFNSLSEREIEIMGFIKKGYSSKEMAETFSLSIKTIEVHRYRILKKLNLKNTTSLVSFIHQSELAFE
jgi:DNA-binding NarL/FixJ family response regulator